MKENYDKLMLETIADLKNTPKLLLHSCCAPCSTYCIKELSEHYLVTVFYYNPNIDTVSEYNLRAKEQQRYIAEFRAKNKVEFLESEYTPSEFEEIAIGRENLPERGERCFLCYKLRLERTAKVAKESGFDYFATTLTLSPLKDAEKINVIGANLEKVYNIKYLPSDFKKREGYKQSLELSKEYKLYRQNYCGCKYSKRGENGI